MFNDEISFSDEVKHLAIKIDFVLYNAETYINEYLYQSLLFVAHIKSFTKMISILLKVTK